jgi:hypothetical protein
MVPPFLVRKTWLKKSWSIYVFYRRNRGGREKGALGIEYLVCDK